MSFLWLIHPDKGLRNALATTIQTVWPELSCNSFAPDETPHSIPEDCIVLKPCSPPRRLAMMLQEVQHQLRQRASPTLVHFETESGIHTLNTRTREWNEADILTEKEVDLLTYLFTRKLPATREDLLRDVWNYAADADTHTIETHIYRLRQKIETNPALPEFLITTKDGYQLALRSNA
jgi:DNA-binding response OmpR family regulator